MDSVITLITGPGGALVFALVILWAGAKKYWVFGWSYKDCVEEKNEWKKAALRGVAVAEKVIDKKENNNEQ